MTKKIIAILVVVMMAVSLFGISVSAERPEGEIPKVETAPELDGEKDAAYDSGLKLSGSSWVKKNADKPADTAFDAYFLHDNEFVYVFIDVKDSTPGGTDWDVNTGFTNRADADGVHLMIHNNYDIDVSATTNLATTNTIYFNRGTIDDLYIAYGVSSTVVDNDENGYCIELVIDLADKLVEETYFVVNFGMIDQPTTAEALGNGGTRLGVLMLNGAAWNYVSADAAKLTLKDYEAPVETTEPEEETTEPEEETTKPADSKPADTTKKDDEKKDEGNNLVWIIAAAAAAVVVVIVIIVVVAKKKKK